MQDKKRSKARKKRAGRRPPNCAKEETGVRAKRAPAPTNKESGGRRGRGKQRRRPVTARVKNVSPRTVIVLILIVFFLAFAFGPTTRNLEATQRLKRKEAELAEQRAATELLKKDVVKTRSLEYVEKEARRQRMVLPGEVLYLVTSQEEESRVKCRVKSLQSMDEAWERVRVMLNCEYSRHEKSE